MRVVVRRAWREDMRDVERVFAFTTIECSGDWFLVAEVSGRVVGAIGLGEDDELVIESLAVLPTYRGRGIGSHLVEQAIEGRSVVSLETAIPGFFKRLGFQEVVEAHRLAPDGTCTCAYCDPSLIPCILV